jgi:hypothetical protein
LKTKHRPGFLKEFTFLNFAFDPRDRFIDVTLPAAWTFVFFSQIGRTNTTVHSAGSDEKGLIHGFHGLSVLKSYS